MKFNYKEKLFDIKRYPSTENKSLKAWNTGDEYILDKIKGLELKDKNIVVSNDRFGFLTTILSEYNTVSVVDFKSQEKAIHKNFSTNGVDNTNAKLVTPLSELKDNIDLALVKVPKSIDLFKLYLSQIHNSITDDGEVICSFMTKNFNKSILKVAEEYFDNVEQSLAWKKSRLLILKNKKQVKNKAPLNEITFDGKKTFKQYYGVFSAKNIDYASQYFINYISVNTEDKKILDLASGNGILAHVLREKCKNCDINLMDDSLLAIESSKLNLSSENTSFDYSDSLDIYENNSFDLVVSNPPFHFEYENNIEISLNLFKGVHSILKKWGRFQMVGNLHLNYKVQLEKIFPEVKIMGQNDKFVVYECTK